MLLVVTGLVVWGSINLFRTGLGRAFVAIRDQDIAASVMGVPVGRYKVLAFSLACGLAGFSGALQAFYLDTQVVTWENYVLEKSFTFVAMIIIGGLGSVSGAIYGAAFLIWLPAYHPTTRLGAPGKLVLLPRFEAGGRSARSVRACPRGLPTRRTPRAGPAVATDQGLFPIMAIPLLTLPTSARPHPKEEFG